MIPSDGALVVPASVTLPPGAGAPAPGVTVSVTAAGQLQVTADAAAVTGTAFVVQALWKGQSARHSMTVG